MIFLPEEDFVNDASPEALFRVFALTNTGRDSLIRVAATNSIHELVDGYEVVEYIFFYHAIFT